jgi:hypothetical protein
METKPRRRGITIKVTVSELAWALLLITVLSQSLMLTILLLNTGGEA